MIFTKTVSPEGIINLDIDGRDLDFRLSREITGTTGEENEGVFNKSVSTEFKFGDFSTDIGFYSNLDPSWCSEDLGIRIKNRISKVRDWVEDCKATAGSLDLSKDNLPGSET